MPDSKMLTKEQVQKIKQQLISQIESSEMSNKNEIKKQIQAMDSEQLEDFLEQNDLIKSRDSGECIFCSIISQKIPSYKIDEDHSALAVLEINPISEGHVLIIPKNHTDDAPKQAFELAKKTAKKISEIFNPKKVDIINNSTFGHEIINVLPVYEDETIHSQKKQSQQKELKKIQELFLSSKNENDENNEYEAEKKPSQEKPKKRIFTDKDTWLPRRIP